MAEPISGSLSRWVSAGLIDEVTAQRIGAFEAGRVDESRLSWPVRIAIALGALMLAAGVLLFVEAHWDRLSPSERFALVVSLVALFHVTGAAVSESFPALSSALHAVGTAALGAGIFLTGQIFNLNEHWPGGIGMWALGAAIGWALLRSWPQAALTAILVPAWLSCEWIDANRGGAEPFRVVGTGLTLLSICYYTSDSRRDPASRALFWIGRVTLLPLCAILAIQDDYLRTPLSASDWLLGGGVALLAPLTLAFLQHGRDAWRQGIAAVWVVVISTLTFHELGARYMEPTVWMYLMYGLGAIAMIAWGWHESLAERINMGVIGFGFTVLAFYFSSIFDKLERAEGFIGLGIVFIGVGGALEVLRRRLVSRLREVTP